MIGGLLAPRDARTFWSSSVIPSDQFLLLTFDHGDSVGPSAAEVADVVIARAPAVADLRLRIAPAPYDLEHPAWAPCDVVDIREGVARTWAEVAPAVARMFANQVDATVAPWRLHVIPHVRDAPACEGYATVVVLQIAHALADGRRASEIARELFRPDPPETPAPVFAPLPGQLRALRGAVGLPLALARTLALGTRVAPARAEIDRRTQRGELPEAVPGCPPTLLNVKPDSTRDVRMLVRERDALTGVGTVTVGALTAISLAVGRYLSLRGADVPAELSAEVTVARPRRSHERNAFGNVSVPLAPTLEPADRPYVISDALRAARERRASGLWLRVGAAEDASPSVLTKVGLARFDLDASPATVGGATVVSSVYRGASDLELLGGRSVFTSGFPALSPAMGLTHGVHGLGDRITVSTTSTRTAVPDPDVYAALLSAALDEVAGLGSA